MDKDVLSYLADIAAVRNHINNILGIARGVIDQKTIHQVSARSTALDQLFVKVFLAGKLPGGVSSSSSPVMINNDDFVDINNRVREEKAKLLAEPEEKPSVPYKTPAQKALEEDEEDEESEEITPSAKALSAGFADDDMEEVAKLLEKAEKQVAKKRGPKKKV